MARVAVVRGGRSLEREISMRSGHHVAAALDKLGHEALEADVDERLTSELADVDVVFGALHGRDGEDGTIPAICEALGVPYTGSDPHSCQLCFDKPLAKGVFAREGIPTPAGYVVSAEAVRRMGAGAALRAGAERLGFPIVVKPAAQGSALGLVVVSSADDLSSGVMTAFNYGDRVLLERFVAGTELAVSVLGPDLEPLPPVEIRTQGEVFDFQTRVTPGGADFVCPADLATETIEAARGVAAQAARALGVRDFGRVDLIVTPDGPSVLEVNPCPGLTETSLLTLAVDEAGVTFPGFVERLVDAALARGRASPV